MKIDPIGNPNPPEREHQGGVPKREHAVTAWDGAGFHREKARMVPESVAAVESPPYSPELNPIENPWRYLQSHCWSNHDYDNCQALEDAAKGSRADRQPDRSRRRGVEPAFTNALPLKQQ